MIHLIAFVYKNAFLIYYPQGGDWVKAVCIYVDGGKGHYVPAKAVSEELAELGVETRLEEFFDYLDIRWIGRINKFFWRTMLRMPRLEQHISKHNDSDSNGMELGIKFAIKHCMRMLDANFDEFQPDLIFTTHPYAGTIISEMLFSAGIEIPVYYFATDVFSAPVASICPRLRKFLISTEEGRARVIKMGQNPETVVLSPFPLQREVAESPKLSKTDARKKLGLDENLFTVQLNLGGEGLGSLSLLSALLKADTPVQVVILGGFDESMKKRIKGIAENARNRESKVHAPGFVKNVSEYLAASDIVAGRAGINTIVEAMYAHRPFLITDLVYTVIPSAEYVEKYHVGWNASEDTQKQLSIILDLASHPEKFSGMDDNFDAIPIEYSAEHLARMLIEDCASLRKPASEF